MKSLTMIAALCLMLRVSALPCPIAAKESKFMGEKEFMVRPIGKVHKAQGRTTLVLKMEFQAALKGLSGFSHVWVLWWLNRSDTPKKRSTLQVHPRGNMDNPLTGVFACRSPARPNPIAISLCRILSVKTNVIEIEEIDAFSDTPVVDLKPYLPDYDSAGASTPSWVEKDKRNRDKKE